MSSVAGKTIEGLDALAGKASKIEHSGAKHGAGAYWGPKQDAKTESKKRRRQADRFLGSSGSEKRPPRSDPSR